MTPEALAALAAANPIAAGIVIVVLVVLGVRNKDSITGWFTNAWASIWGKTTDTADSAKAKMAAVGDDVKAKFESVLADVGAVGGDIEASVLLLGTRALWHRYLKRVAEADKTAVNTAFQTLSDINARLPLDTPATPTT